MTEQQAYIIHRAVAEKIKDFFNINPIELARVAFSVNRKESNFNERAKNKNSSARGMMQMLLGTQREIETKYLNVPHDPERIWDAEYAVFLGQYELARQIIRYKGDVRKGVHAYNRGSYLPKNKKSFAAGELYTNSVFATHNKTDYAVLEQSVNRALALNNLHPAHRRRYTMG